MGGRVQNRSKALLAAIDDDDRAAVETQLTKSSAILQHALFHAIDKDRVAIVELLLAKVSVNAIDTYGRLPIHNAKSRPMVELLVARGANVTFVDSRFDDALHMYPNDDPAVARLLLERGLQPRRFTTPREPTERRDRSHLANALRRGFVAIVDVLLAHGGSPDEFDENGVPVLFAALEKSAALAVHLIEKGASVDVHDQMRRPFVDVVAIHGDAPLLALVLARSKVAIDLAPLLLITADRGNTEMITIVLEKGVDVNHADPNTGATALMAARRSVAAIELLLRCGAAIDLADRDGLTALHHAAKAGNLAGVKLLLDHGAPLVRDARRRTVLHHAATCEGHHGLVDLLIDRGCAVDDRDIDEMTPLIAAGEHGVVNARDALVARGADAKAVDKHGRTYDTLAAEHWQWIAAQHDQR